MIERSFLQIKNKYLDRSKVFNAIQLIQKISENYEISTKIKLIDFRSNRYEYVYSGLKIKGSELKKSARRIAKAQLSDFVYTIEQPERNCITDLASFDSMNKRTLNYIHEIDCLSKSDDYSAKQQSENEHHSNIDKLSPNISL